MEFPKKNSLTLGSSYGLSGGWPHYTIVRDKDGRYYSERLSDDLKSFIREEISETEAIHCIVLDKERRDEE